ncbi:MAG: folylpolyglutamate synthase/dihydrofolate synthase family protein [Lachnospiraceae bacterium]
MNYRETIAYIEEVNQYGSALGLENIRALLEQLDNPQDTLRFVHIAGTNGKGSTLAYLSTILQKAGYKVGRYCSPTIFDYRERFQINARSISKVALARYMTQVKDAVAVMQEQGLPHPTLFELETALAFLYYKDSLCDIVVLETGLGGALDATNVIRNTVVAVISSISMDHMQFLGNNLAAIAAQKAGIIKNACYVVTSEQKAEAMSVLQERCRELTVPITVASSKNAYNIKSGINKHVFSYAEYSNLEIGLAGTCQIDNAVLAIETSRVLCKLGYQISKKALYSGLAETIWPGRFTVLSKRPYFIADGAHNEDAAKRLAEAIRLYFGGKRIIYICGILQDKEHDKIMQELCPYAEQVITITTPHNPRATPAYDLACEMRQYHPHVTTADSIEEAVEMSYLLADKESVIIAFGSLSYLGDLMKIVQNRDKMRRDTHGRSE